MKKTTKVILRSIVVMVASILVITVSLSLIGSAVKFIDYSLRLSDTKQRASTIGWTDQISEDYNVLIKERQDWAQKQDFRVWLLSCSSTKFGGLLRIIVTILIVGSLIFALMILFSSISTIYRIVRAFIAKKSFRLNERI